MDEYIVSARKYRPMTFASVVGQDALTTTLRNAVKSGKLAHAYLFCGPRGVGKTTCARIFAKTINCSNPTPDGEACNECESCKAFNEGRSLNIMELDAASNNSVENIKSLIDQTRIPPQLGRYKVFIIDEVHMLSSQAFNAFLKTLEEPPAHVIFILATTEKNKILPTILSRCQIYDFQRMTVPEIVSHLKMVASKENIQYEEAALDIIAEKADGGMRDALSIFDQAASFSQGNITYQKVIEDLNVLDSDYYFRIVDLALENKASDIMLLLNNIINKGFNGGGLVNGLASHVRNVLMAKDPQTLPLLEASETTRKRYAEQGQRCPTAFLYKALRIMNRCDVEYRQSSNKRLLVELTLIEIAQLTQPDDDSAGAGRSPERLKSLFHKPQTASSKPKAAEQVAAAAPAPAAPAAPSAEPKDSPAESKTTPSAPSAPTPVGGLKLAGLDMSFGSIMQEYGDKADKPLDDKPITDTASTSASTTEQAFTQEQLDVQWRAMCARMPQMYQGLASRMRGLQPRITDYPKIEVVVENSILLKQLSDIGSRIRATMVNALHNEQISVNFRLAEGSEVKPVLTKRQLLEKMQQKQPGISKLISRLQLTID